MKCNALIAVDTYIGSVRENLQRLALSGLSIIAVSGGRDSMVLSALCQEFSRKTGTRFHVITVDHGLREAAKDEARQVREWCQRIGLPHSIMTWQGKIPSSGKQAFARNVRYRFLLEEAYRLGASAILTAHTLDDQAETILMRMKRQSGVEGLSGLEPERPVAFGAGAALRLLRPMLSCSREAITAYASRYSVPYLDDPSNEDMVYERVRVRQHLRDNPTYDGFGIHMLGDLAEMMRHAAYAKQASRDDQVQSSGTVFYGWGGIGVDRPDQIPGDEGDFWRALIYAVSGNTYPSNEVESLTAVQKARAYGGASLNGTLIKYRADKMFILREPAAIHGRGRGGVQGKGQAQSVNLPSHTAILWDRRFVVSASEPLMSIRSFNPEKVKAALAPVLYPYYQQIAATLPAVNIVRGDGKILRSLVWSGGVPPGMQCCSLLRERFARRVIRFNS